MVEIEDNLKFQNNPSIQEIIRGEIIYFSTKINKIATDMVVKKHQDRNFVVTNAAIYNLKKFELRRRMKIEDIKAITISKTSDQFIIHGNIYHFDYLYISPERT